MIAARRCALLILAAAGVAAFSGEAAAQSAQCQRARADLAALERDARTPRPGAARASAELAQVQARYASIGCNKQQFLFFGSAPPAECGGLRARISTLQAQASAGGAGAFGARRQQLLAAVDQHCNPRAVASTAAPPPPQQPRGLFETLFGAPREPPVQQIPPPTIDPETRVKAPIDPDDQTRRRGFGGGRPVCVRTCDGFFFPLANSPGGREGVDEMCQALCPGTETLAYFMSGENIESASRRDGSQYVDLPNASKFKRSFDQACGCKKPGQTWAQVLGHAEEILGSHGSDIIVSAAKAEEMSRPQLGPPPGSPKDVKKEARDAKGRKKNEPPPKVEAAAVPPPAAPATPATPPADTIINPAVISEEAAQPQQPLVTDGGDSAGINDKVKAAPFVGRTQGEKKETVTPTGVRKQVRVIGAEPPAER